MNERDLAEQFLQDHVLASRALAALLLNQLPEEIRSRVNLAIANRTGYTELRTRIDTGETVSSGAGRWVGAALADADWLLVVKLRPVHDQISHSPSDSTSRMTP